MTHFERTELLLDAFYLYRNNLSIEGEQLASPFRIKLHPLPLSPVTLCDLRGHAHPLPAQKLLLRDTARSRSGFCHSARMWLLPKQAKS